jgi:hypothetical protein
MPIANFSEGERNKGLNAVCFRFCALFVCEKRKRFAKYVLFKLLKNKYLNLRELFGCYWKSYISFAVVGVSPTTLVACEDTSDGERNMFCLNC